MNTPRLKLFVNIGLLIMLDCRWFRLTLSNGALLGPSQSKDHKSIQTRHFLGSKCFQLLNCTPKYRRSIDDVIHDPDLLLLVLVGTVVVVVVVKGELVSDISVQNEIHL